MDFIYSPTALKNDFMRVRIASTIYTPRSPASSPPPPPPPPRAPKTQKVDFSPKNKVVPGDKRRPFPPDRFRPGSFGDEYYSPLVAIDNVGGSVWNAPIVASGVHTDYLNQFCDMDAIPDDMAEEAYRCVNII